jgi:hypothetical protein
LDKGCTPHNTSIGFNSGGKNSFYLVKSVGKPEAVSRTKELYPKSRSNIGSNEWFSHKLRHL